jgi:predicted nucleic acid-binding protein
MPDLVINTGPVIALCAALEDLAALKSCYSTGMLVKCAKSGAIPDLDTCFSAMKSKGIWISDAIRQEALAEAQR